MAQSLLITRPEHDEAMLYLSKWSATIIEEARRKGLNVIDLHRKKANRKKANRKKVIGILEKRAPKLVVLNGHGSESAVAGHDDETILKEGDAKAVKSKIFFGRSCKSAKSLGQDVINNGATAYLGYKEDFWLFYSENKVFRPLEDKTAELFLQPSNYVPIALLKGHTTGQANSKSKGWFKKNIEKLVVEGPTSDNYYAIRYLFWDMTHQVCLGDQDAVF